MLAVYAECILKENTIAEFLRIAESLAVHSRQEQGCISYHYGQVLEKQNTFAFVALWQSQDILNKHRDTYHFQQAMREFNQILAQEMNIHFVEC